MGSAKCISSSSVKIALLRSFSKRNQLDIFTNASSEADTVHTKKLFNQVVIIYVHAQLNEI